MVLIGLDLKKSPSTILAADNDKAGITKRFNLNLLERINREQQVTMCYDGEPQQIRFARHEEIFMEISQKYSIDQVDHLADQAFFNPIKRFYDSRGWFVDALWLAV